MGLAMLDLALSPASWLNGSGKEERRLESFKTLGWNLCLLLDPHQCPEQSPGATEITVPGHSLSTRKQERVRRSAKCRPSVRKGQRGPGRRCALPSPPAEASGQELEPTDVVSGRDSISCWFCPFPYAHPYRKARACSPPPRPVRGGEGAGSAGGVTAPARTSASCSFA